MRKISESIGINLFKIITVVLFVIREVPLSAQTDTTLILPSTNSKIIQYCDSIMGKKVGRGECWDLAKYALDYSGAKWAAPFDFGRKLKSEEDVKPGDIIQFEKVKITYPNNYHTNMPQHTSIIYEVLGIKHFILAEQNINKKRFVMKNEINLTYLKTGKFTVYRPQ